VGSVIPIVSRGAEDRGSIVRSIAIGAEPFASGDAIQIKIENQEDRSLYLSCLAIDDFNNLIVLYPADFESPEDASQIDAGGSLIVPRPQDELKFALSGSGQIQLLTLVSTQPLRNVLRGLKTIARSRGISRGFLQTEGDEPLDIIAGLLGDLDNLSRSRRGGSATIAIAPKNNQTPADRAVLAAFSTAIEIRERSGV
jgi:Domain of unknown function (DUF4384)